VSAGWEEAPADWGEPPAFALMPARVFAPHFLGPKGVACSFAAVRALANGPKLAALRLHRDLTSYPSASRYSTARLRISSSLGSVVTFTFDPCSSSASPRRRSTAFNFMSSGPLDP
jgi:hypothetical protein